MFLSSFFTLLAMGRLSKYDVLLLITLLFTPQFLLKILTHLRQGLAIAFYLIFLFSLPIIIAVWIVIPIIIATLIVLGFVLIFIK
jgi:hypothetical protein